MNIQREKAPEGALCTTDTDLGNPEPTPCGEPAVIAWRIEGEDEEDTRYWCEDCQLARMRSNAAADQSAAHEADWGWPMGTDLQDIGFSLGRALANYEKFLDLNAPVTILWAQKVLLDRRKRWASSWLAARPPSEKYQSHVGAVNAFLEDVTESYALEPRDTDLRALMLSGIREIRRLAGDVDREISEKKSPS